MPYFGGFFFQPGIFSNEKWPMPGVGQNIALHASSTAGNVSFQVYSTSFPQFFSNIRVLPCAVDEHSDFDPFAGDLVIFFSRHDLRG